MLAARLLIKPFASPTLRRFYSTPSTSNFVSDTTTTGTASVTSTQTTEPFDQTDVFHRVDLRIGKIVDVKLHPTAEHLYIETVDLGESENRTIVSGLVKYISKENLNDKNVIVVANMKPSRFRGVLSQGMLLAASSQDQAVVDLLTPNGPVGERVQIQGVDSLASPDAVLNPKKKVFEQVAPYLKTDKDGVATYKGLPLATTAGLVTSKLVKLGQIS
ncbi:hypothetical protein BC941DRAFT_442272 [Chlamydoabsidia padenii]|nr:hypothetical protein BC941DRAFT_442272 [Chlamydoabsidia padenii]